MRIPLFQLDAFAGDLFSGNPAAVCPLERWLDDRVLQAIAEENNLAETAFFVRRPSAAGGEPAYDLRWFTPTVEMELCGHATLASAWVLFHRGGRRGDRIEFHTLSGVLAVRRDGERLELDFPAAPGTPCDAPPQPVEGLGMTPVATLIGSDYLAEVDREDDIRSITPRFE